MTNGMNGWEGKDLADGRYRVSEKLGEGGMGAVYRALDQNLDADVVIKVPTRAALDDPGFVRRFEIEIRSLAKLSHPHIVKVSDVGTCDGHPFAVMQYLPGGNLEGRRPEGPDGPIAIPDPRDVTRWLPGIAMALDYVHSREYVHRDVKPGNILFDLQGHPFLSDFGVVKVVASAADTAAKNRTSMTGAGMVVGTPEYMAPELIMGEPFDGRADQYALAVTVYEMLAGRRPFEDETKTKLLVLHTAKPVPPLAELCKWIPEPVSQAVLKGLAKVPSERYDNCAAFSKAVCEAIETAFSGQPERLRLTCPSCHKSIRLPPADFEKIQKSGRPLPCPGCQTAIQVARNASRSSPATVPQGTMVEPVARRGTMIESASGSSDGLLFDTTRNRTPTPVRAATVVMGASPATVVESALTPIKPRSATMVEPIGGRAAATQVLPGLDTIGPGSGLVEEDSPGSRSMSVGAIAGIATGVTALAVAVLWLTLGGGGKTPTVAPADKNVAQAPPSITSADLRITPTRSGKPGALLASNDSPAPSHGATGAASPPEKEEEEKATSEATPTVEAESDAKPPEATPAAESDRDAAEIETAPKPGGPVSYSTKTRVALKKLLDAPALFANQVVEIEELILVQEVRSGGGSANASHLIATESRGLSFDGAPVTARGASRRFELDLDPQLALQLRNHWGALRINPVLPTLSLVNLRPRALMSLDAGGEHQAILTLQVHPSPGGKGRIGRVVKLEFFKGFTLTPSGKKTYKPVLHVVFETATITPDGLSTGTGDINAWKRENRLLFAANKLASRFNGAVSQQMENKRQSIGKQLDRQFQKGMSDSAREQNRQLEQGKRRIGL